MKVDPLVVVMAVLIGGIMKVELAQVVESVLIEVVGTGMMVGRVEVVTVLVSGVTTALVVRVVEVEEVVLECWRWNHEVEMLVEVGVVVEGVVVEVVVLEVVEVEVVVAPTW